MKILITGASGFVGHRVAQKLIERFGYNNIIALSSSEIKDIKCLESLDYKFGNEYLKTQCPDVNTVFHIGAFTPKLGAEANNIEKSMSNIVNTQKLISACSKLENLQKFIFTSSIDVYGTFSEVIDENTVTIPTTLYGWSKLFCEKMLQTYCNEAKISYTILRLGHVFGDGESKYKKVIPVMIKSALNSQPINIYGDGEALRSFIYIEDATNAIVNAINSENSSVINVVGNKAVSVKEIANMIIKLVNTDVSVNYVSSNITNQNSVFDNRKLIESLLPSFTLLEKGLMNEIEYFRKLQS